LVPKGISLAACPQKQLLSRSYLVKSECQTIRLMRIWSSLNYFDETR
jgi:hypothetical protein